jgi:prepilin-type N-terminal cleavage/methylation domain-containing protein
VVSGKRESGVEGVTLIELAVVLSIISIIALLGTDYLRGFVSRYKLDSEAREMMGRLRFAKVLSITKNAPVTVIIDASGGTYYAFLDRDRDSIRDAGENYIDLDSGSESASEVSTAIRNGVTVTGVNFSGTTPTTITITPPSGLNDMSPTLVNGAVCFRATVGDEVKWRRITLTPVVGRAVLWRSDAASPGCPISNDLNWERAD